MVALTFVGCPLVCGSNLTAHARDGGTGRSSPFEVTYSRWSPGGCSINQIADLVCWMGLEARSTSGELLGRVLFGQQERSRFLAIEAARSASGISLVLSIDGVAISKSVACRGDGKFCEVVVSVDKELLDRLIRGSALTVDVQGETRLHFPLRDFAQARRTLL